MNNAMFNILNDMSEHLNMTQMKKLQEVLIERLESSHEEIDYATNGSYMEMFLTAKQIEGCSSRTIQYYKTTIEHLLDNIDIPLRKMTTEMLRMYLSDYQARNDCSKECQSRKMRLVL